MSRTPVSDVFNHRQHWTDILSHSSKAARNAEREDEASRIFVRSLIFCNESDQNKSACQEKEFGSLQSLPGEQQPSVKHRTMNITQFDEYLLKYWMSDSVAIIISLLWIWWWILKWTYCVIFSYFLSYLLCMCWTVIIKTDFQIMKCVGTNKYPDSDNSFYSRSFFDDAGEGISQIWSKKTHPPAVSERLFSTREWGSQGDKVFFLYSVLKVFSVL